ncbi:MAG TPA: glycogen/starch synthase, partial [Desulfurivibrionaceae bacterium]|nr:glycogen/starch synthase [Desulfurivibrionaceae bacterium]
MAKKKDATPRTIWMIAREYDGLAGAGGVKDVVRQLSEALARAGHRVSVVLPLYGFMDPKALGFASLGLAFEVAMNYEAEERRELVRIFAKTVPDGGELTIYLLDAQRYLEKKSVYTYTAEDEAQNPFHAQGSGHYD